MARSIGLLTSMLTALTLLSPASPVAAAEPRRLGTEEVPARDDAERRQIARELAALTVDDAMRRTVDEQLVRGVMQATAATLEERLGRRLQDVEWKLLADIVVRFIRDAMPPERIELIAADIYAQHFDTAELQELLRFQRSPVGRKAARLSPRIAVDTVQAIDRELRASAALPGMLLDLQRVFPILGSGQSP